MRFEAYARLSKWVMGFVVLLGLFHIWGIFEAAKGPSVLSFLSDDFEEQGRILEEAWKQVGFVILQRIVFVLKLIPGLIWFRKANIMTRALGARGMEFTPGSAVSSCLVPVANLWRPFQAMKEIWKASSGEINWSSEATPIFLKIWWFFWVLPVVIFFATQIFLPPIPGLSIMAEIAVSMAVTYLIQDICFIHLIHKVVERQRTTRAGGIAKVFS